jgi:metal-dependent amidase/aminoacylase/carboxypeptidase family protein
MPNHKSIRAFMTQFLLRCARRQTEISLAAAGALTTMPAMLSHVVVFWTNPAQPGAADELIAGANRFLKSIPGVLQFHVGKMVPRERPAVEKSYQVALNIVFPTKQAEQEYQVHPQHVEFVEKIFKRTCKRVVIYDFE